MLDIYNEVGSWNVRAITIADASDMLLFYLRQSGELVEVLIDGNYIKTKELLFINSIILKPGIKSFPMKTRWTSEKALDEYTKEIVTDEVPEGFEYTYGHLMRYPIDQVEKVIEILKKDPSSREATIALGYSNAMNLKYPPCCRMVDFKIRYGLLNMFLVFRSHDVTAYFPNLWGFARLQEMVAKELNIPVGIMGCTSESLHIYEGDWNLL